MPETPILITRVEQHRDLMDATVGGIFYGYGDSHTVAVPGPASVRVTLACGHAFDLTDPKQLFLSNGNTRVHMWCLICQPVQARENRNA